MGGRTCTVCSKSPAEVQLINNEILRGESMRDIGKRHGVSKDAVNRHKNNCIVAGEAVTEALAAPAVAFGSEGTVGVDTHKYNFVHDIMALKDRALKLLDKAEKQKNLSMAVSIMREIRGQVETIIKVALAQRELEQRDLDKEEMEAGIRDVSPDILEVIRRGIESEELVDVDYDVIADLGLEDIGGNGNGSDK